MYFFCFVQSILCIFSVRKCLCIISTGALLFADVPCLHAATSSLSHQPPGEAPQVWPTSPDSSPLSQDA